MDLLRNIEIEKFEDLLKKIHVLSKIEVTHCLQSILDIQKTDLNVAADPVLTARILLGRNLRFLCRIDSKRTCAGCCDNFKESKEVLTAKYQWRKSAYRNMVKKKRDFQKYKELVRAHENRSSRCAYVAFVGSGNKAVGCLLHPKNQDNNGIDYRNYGIYGSGLCDAYVCSGIKTLEKAPLEDRLIFLQLLKYSDNWYYYSRLFSPSVTYGYHRGVIEIFLHCKEHV